MRPETAGHLAMFCFAALVAGSFALGAMAANAIAPAALNALRFWIAAGLMGALAWSGGQISWRAAEAPWRYLALAALMATYFVTMFEGLKTAPPVSAAAVFTLTPLMAAGFGWLLMGQRLTGRMALALIIGGTGAIWVIFRADLPALLAFEVGRGEAVYFWGCVAHALYTPLVRRLNRGEPPLVFAFGTLLGTAILTTLWGLGEIVATDWTALPAIVWITIAYTAIFASAASFLMLQIATLRLPSAKVMAYTYLIPTWVIGWQLVLGHGLPPALVAVGVGLTVVSLVMLLRD